MSLYPPPPLIEAEIWSTLPDRFRIRDTAPDWASANKPGRQIDSFLEGPSFDRAGNLWVTDIPYGRVFRISPDGDWTLIAQYDGWPNGLKIAADGSIWIADYKRGIVTLDPGTGTVTDVVTHRYSEHFRGCNDLVFGPDGALYFTDQGQSGMHMPNGRVYRYTRDTGRLDLLLDTGPSPNGLVLNASGDVLWVAMTRANAVWRLPLMADGAVSKVGVFVQLSGGLSGPDGIARDAEGGLWVAHAGNGCVWGFSALGHPVARLVSPEGLTTTNIAFRPGTREIFVTQSDTGCILRGRLSVAGALMASHG
jgi:gluconolactonase